MDKTKIDWADATWNPVTGCKHGCEYCYARRIAERFGGVKHHGAIRGTAEIVLDDVYVAVNGKKNPYPYGFYPTFHCYLLDRPRHWKKPRNIFVCSMADLFGDWVPDEWIKAVFRACEAAPQHRYLFLTKNPHRYFELDAEVFKRENYWFGSSTTGRIGESIFSCRQGNAFLSIEPFMELPGLLEDSLDRGLRWTIVGAETGNRKEKITPKREQIQDIADMCNKNGIPLFMKESLRGLMGSDFVQEFPW